MCGNSGEAFVHRRKQNTDRSTEDSDWKCFSSGERPLHGGVYQKIAPAPGKPISPEENIQNVWKLRRSLRSPEEMTNGECFLLPSPLCIMEQRDCNHE